MCKYHIFSIMDLFLLKSPDHMMTMTVPDRGMTWPCCKVKKIEISYRDICSVICFDLQFSRSTRPMTSFCIFIAYINTEGILFNLKIVKYVSIDGILQTFVFFRFVDIINITVHERFWNLGQANCILKYFENMMIDHSDSTIF